MCFHSGRFFHLTVLTHSIRRHRTRLCLAVPAPLQPQRRASVSRDALQMLIRYILSFRFHRGLAAVAVFPLPRLHGRFHHSKCFIICRIVAIRIDFRFPNAERNAIIVSRVGCFAAKQPICFNCRALVNTRPGRERPGDV